MSTLLEQIGGEAAVKAAVNAFYVKVLADPLLQPFFAKTNMDLQRLRQAKFLISLMSGTASNAEEYMRVSHRKIVKEMGLNDTHFDAVEAHLVATLRELKVPENLISQIDGAMQSLRAAVLDRPSATQAA